MVIIVYNFASNLLFISFILRYYAKLIYFSFFFYKNKYCTLNFCFHSLLFLFFDIVLLIKIKKNFQKQKRKAKMYSFLDIECNKLTKRIKKKERETMYVCVYL